ncbi:MAG: alpha/beta hydrolase [Suipraeoptans sp.]
MASSKMDQLKETMKQMMAVGFAPKFDGSVDVDVLRTTINGAQKRMPTEPGVTFETINYGGIDGEINHPQEEDDSAIILYIHGGGLITGDAFSSRGYGSVLAAESGFPVYTVSYRLAPENPFPACYEDCYHFYQAIAAKYQDKPVYLVGESGGAYLCLAVSMIARDNGIKSPAAIAPYSVPIDFTGHIDRTSAKDQDFTINADGMNWLKSLLDPEGKFVNEKYAHPYLDDMKGMPPMFLAWDDNEHLAIDQEILAEKVKAAGGEVECKAYPDCFHAFATANRGTPESYEILRNTIAFFKAHK